MVNLNKRKIFEVLRRNFFLLLIILLFLLTIPLFVHKFFVPVQYNQFLIQKLESRYGIISTENFLDYIHSTYSSGINYIRTGKIKEPSIENSEEVFSYVMDYMPRYAIVYPTERFYYFNTFIDFEPISGNIRMADIEKGEIGIAYFRTKDMYSQTFVKVFNESDGLTFEKLSDRFYRINYRDNSILLKIPTTDITPPKKLVLLSEEEFIGHIHDESGIKFFLIYSNETNAFYDLLDDEDGVADKLIEVDKNLFLGARTEFFFYRDESYNRTLFVGSKLDNIADNNYLDGPGDQVPIAIPIRDKLHKVYPHTLLGEGVDEFGVSLNKTDGWKRVAITPFERYYTPEDVSFRMQYCLAKNITGSFLWTCMTREFWDNKLFREDIKNKLREEGKNVTVLEFVDI
jgi:hypothetical protein